jgi:hypothetical protein
MISPVGQIAAGSHGIGVVWAKHSQTVNEQLLECGCVSRLAVQVCQVATGLPELMDLLRRFYRAAAADNKPAYSRTMPTMDRRSAGSAPVSSCPVAAAVLRPGGTGTGVLTRPRRAASGARIVSDGPVYPQFGWPVPSGHDYYAGGAAALADASCALPSPRRLAGASADACE